MLTFLRSVFVLAAHTYETRQMMSTVDVYTVLQFQLRDMFGVLTLS